jgi:hypothetical protein
VAYGGGASVIQDEGAHAGRGKQLLSLSIRKKKNPTPVEIYNWLLILATDKTP